MGKQRIGTLLGGKPIIKGDMNLKTANEIHISELIEAGYELASNEEIRAVAKSVFSK